MSVAGMNLFGKGQKKVENIYMQKFRGSPAFADEDQFIED